MKFRTKLYLAFTLISFIGSLLAIGFVFLEAKQILRTSFQQKLETIVAVTSSFLPGDEILLIKAKEDADNPAYKKYKDLLDRLQRRLQSEGVPVSHFYTLFRDKDDPSEMLFGINTADDPLEVLPPGFSYAAANKPSFLKKYGTFFTSDSPYIGTYGRWFSAFAPIKDSSNHVVGMLGIDVSADNYDTSMSRMFNTHIISLSISLVVSLLLAYLFSRRVSRSLSLLSQSVEYMSHGHFEAQVRLKTKDEFSRLAHEINHIGKALSQRSVLEENFSSYVSYPVLQQILHSPPDFEGEKREITALFADLNDFTQLSQVLSPEELVGMLNSYFEVMIDIIFKYKGTLENYRGDGFLVIFGAPIQDPHKEQNALNAAYEMIDALENVKKRGKAKHWPTLKLNIGIHTGDALIGIIGKEVRMHYTAIGNTVHIAQQIALESNKRAASLIISESTYEPVKQLLTAEKLTDLELTDLKTTLPIYQIKKED